MAFLEINHARGDLDERGRVGCGEVLSITETEQQRRAHTCYDETLRIVFIYDCDRVRADELLHARMNGSKQGGALCDVRTHQMRIDFAVRVGRPLIAFALQAAA